MNNPARWHPAIDHLNPELFNRWQVFGLADDSACLTARRLLLAVASQPLRASASLTAVVSAYRCGAVPELHQVPSCRDHNGLWSTSNEAQHIAS